MRNKEQILSMLNELEELNIINPNKKLKKLDTLCLVLSKEMDKISLLSETDIDEWYAAVKKYLHDEVN